MNDLTEIWKNMDNWEIELENNGFLRDETELFSVIETLNPEVHSTELSRLMSIAAMSRIGRNKKDAVARHWMHLALELNPQNQKASTYLHTEDLRNKKDFLKILSFPIIRETDNRTTKKKIADEYIRICTQFIDAAEDEVNSQGLAHKNEVKDALSEMMKKLLAEALEETIQLLKAAHEYEDSITGVFHTSTHFHDLKQHASNIEEIKKKWNSLFEEMYVNSDEAASLQELNEMIGLKTVKERINDFYRFLQFQEERKANGFRTKDELSLNMVLTGNPGTGKTTLARLLAKIYHELGVLPRQEVVESDRSQLVGSFVGQTEENVRVAVQKALGGVLFIDEAYSLKRDGQSGSDYGQSAIDTLVSLMTGEEFGGKFAVILAGYPDEMRAFLDANPGLRSRFPQSNFIALPDYSEEELVTIAEKMADDNDYLLTEGAKIALKEKLEKERVDDTFGNARTVRNLVLNAIFRKGSKYIPSRSLLRYTLLNKEDFAEPDDNPEDAPSVLLEQLIGLNELKVEMNSLLSFVKMQQLRKMHKLPGVPIQLHAVFSGNPGTGKTTVAKVYAQLLKQYGILKRGHLIVASRADFVAGYVGQTAGKTRKKIKQALGGVLFIDEAYSLLGQTAGDFGKEVVDTLVDEMTRHNENLVVVLAGYPDEIRRLLDSNPGLRSRFKKFFVFPDYTIEELIEIMELYAGEFQYQLTEEAKIFLLDALKEYPISGNGRFSTNLVDESMQAQAMRLIREAIFEGLEEKACNLEKEDVQVALLKMRKGER